MGDSNSIKNVAIVGASGNIGSHISEGLLNTGKHSVTAITRSGSKSKPPEGLLAKNVDYDKPETLVEALKGQDALVITLSADAPEGTEEKLVKAAGEAGVPWILTNEWCPDSRNEGLVRDVAALQPKLATRKALNELGKSSYISLGTSLWYEWSLSMKPAIGFDFPNRTALFFDDGNTKVSYSTWPQIGRAVASLLSLPVKAEGTDACLESLRNQIVRINSFTVSQRDILESAMRVTGTKESDWTITSEPTKERYTKNLEEMKDGNRASFVKMMFARVLYPDENANFERLGTLNSLLNLPKEDLDEATKAGIERSKAPTSDV